jgi:hypothetical protein
VPNDIAQETIDYIAIRRLQSAYGDIVTRRAWAEMHDIFRPEAQVVVDTMDGNPLHLDGPQGVGDFISNAIAHFDFFEFVILNTVIDIDGDTATGRMYIWELRHDPVTGRSNAYGLYRDRFTKFDGRWWFAGRRYQSLARTNRAELSIFPFPEM